jgi:hypothetical protein
LRESDVELGAGAKRRRKRAARGRALLGGARFNAASAASRDIAVNALIIGPVVMDARLSRHEPGFPTREKEPARHFILNDTTKLRKF